MNSPFSYRAKVEYLVFEHDLTEYRERLKKLKDIGYSIDGIPDYYNPITTYALCCHQGVWCFGTLTKNKFDWHKHKQKPRSFSNSISLSIAKALVNIASMGNKESMMLDVCCGVGTIILEACFSGNNIEGCDINEKVCNYAKEKGLNLAFEPGDYLVKDAGILVTEVNTVEEKQGKLWEIYI